MRVLPTFLGGGGHLEPLAPVAHAVRRAGHEVAALPPVDEVVASLKDLAGRPTG